MELYICGANCIGYVGKEKIQLVAMTLVNKCRDVNVKEVACVSSLTEDDYSKCVIELKELVKEYGITLHMFENPASNLSELPTIAQYGNVVVFERMNKSKMKNLRAMCEILCRNDLHVLGTIIF